MTTESSEPQLSPSALAARDLDERRQEVRLLNRKRHAASFGLPWPVDQERDVEHFAVKVPAVAKHTALLEGFPVVGNDGNEGVAAPPPQFVP